jgi:acetate---CoA ligase (ADP-forming)
MRSPGPPGGRTQEPHPLARLFEPRAVAVIGASETPGKYGCILLRTLIEQGYPGRIVPVNPKGGALLGHSFLRSLDEVEGPIDLALVVRPADEAVAVVGEVARRGIPFAIVYAAGFSEHGPEGQERERRLVEAAAAGGTRVVGPNCMNIFSAPARLNLSAIDPFPAGGLGFLSASGNLGFALAQEAARRGTVGFSRFISAGNQADLALDDYLDFLRADPETRVVLVFAEGFVRGRGRRFLEVLRRTVSEKPVLLLRGGRTSAGQGTARSHTGALAGAPEVARQALEQGGAVLLDRADEALAVAEAFLDSPLPGGDRVALLGEGGGHATLLTDACVEADLEVRPFPEALVERMRPLLPPFAAILRNPIEFGGHSEYDLRIYDRVAETLAGWEGCAQLLLFGGYALYDEGLCDVLAGLREKTGKPILLHDLYAGEDRPGLHAVRRRRLPLYGSVEVMARAAAALARGNRGRARARRSLGDAGHPDTDPASLPPSLRDLLQAARARPARALSEDEATHLMAHFGVPVLPATLATGPREAVEAAGRIGFPVVLKLDDPGLVHKSEAGGVRLDLRGPEAVREACDDLLRRTSGDGRPRRVRVTPYRPGGIEAIAGVRRDPDYGPILLFGSGGMLAETLHDASVRTLPCPTAEIEEMIGSTRLARLLAGQRGAAPADGAAIVATLRSLATLLLTCPEIQDAEINPLRCAPDGAVALDSRVLLRPVMG